MLPASLISLWARRHARALLPRGLGPAFVPAPALSRCASGSRGGGRGSGRGGGRGSGRGSGGGRRAPPDSFARGPRAPAASAPPPSSASASGPAPASASFVANDDVVRLHPEAVLVIGEDRANLGVLPAAQALALAHGRGLDLVVVASPPAPQPPVCRLGRLADMQAAVSAREAAVQAAGVGGGLSSARSSSAGTPSSSSSSMASAQPPRKPKEKEMRLTARTGDHDLGVKAARVVEFLRAGHSVRVSASFSKAQAAWAKEEPARREVFAKVVRAVAASGAGFVDASSIQGAGAALSGLFQATATPRPVADWDRALLKLADPLRPADSRGTAAALARPASAPASGPLAGAGAPAEPALALDIALPPVSQLLKGRSSLYRSPRAAPAPSAPVHDDDADVFALRAAESFASAARGAGAVVGKGRARPGAAVPRGRGR